MSRQPGSNDWPTAAVIVAGILALAGVLIWAPPAVSGPVVVAVVVIVFLLLM